MNWTSNRPNSSLLIYPWTVTSAGKSLLAILLQQAMAKAKREQPCMLFVINLTDEEILSVRPVNGDLDAEIAWRGNGLVHAVPSQR